MANYILQELPEDLSDGKKVVFPKMQTYSLHDYETVLKHMRTYAGNFSEGTMRAVFDALISTMVSWMPLGHNIKIDGLGVFSLSLGFDTSTPSERAIANADESDNGDNQGSAKNKYRHVCIKGINFKPDPQLLKNMNSEATFDRIESEVIVPKKQKHSYEERISIAQELIRKNGFMTLSDYAIATGFCRTAASNDLRKLVADPNSHITIRGSHSHKVWIQKTE